MYTLRDKQKKYIRILLWVLGSIVALIVVALTILQVYVNTNKASFVKTVNEKLNDAIAGKVEIKDIDINVWRHFPNVDIRLHDVSIKDSVYNKPLVQLKYMSTRLNALKLISNQVDIHNLYLENGLIHIFTDKNGYSNNYIFKSNKEKKPGAHPAIIDEIELKNVGFVSAQEVKEKWFGIKAMNLHADLDYNDSITNIRLKENVLVKGLGFNLSNGYFLKDKVLKGDWKLSYNSQSKQLSFGETPVQIGPTDFRLKGDFYLADTLNAHLQWV